MEYHIKQNETGQWVESLEPTQTKVTTTHQGLKLYLKFLNEHETKEAPIEEVIEVVEEVKPKPKKSRKK